MARGIARVTGGALAPYQTAVVRIGFAATWLLFMLREWPNRHELYGPDSPWSWALADRLIESNHAFTVLLWSDGAVWFEFVYLLAIASAVALLVGWRTRTVSVLFMIGVLALQNRSVFMGDGGDNVIHLMSMYLVLTRCGQVWSLDARRERRRGVMPAEERDTVGVALWFVFGAVLVAATITGGLSLGWGLFFWVLWASHAAWRLVNRYAPHSEVRSVCDMLANLAHNGAMLVIVVEVCLIYSTAGWYKIQGSRWQDGTAVYYPMNLDYFSPWPELNVVLAGSGLITLLVTYGTVAVQVAFPFALFNRRVKNVLLAAMITEHLSIALLLGLPFFSMAMVAADAVFLPTVALLWLGARFSGGRKRLLARLRPSRGSHESGRGGAGGDVYDADPSAAPPTAPQQRSGDGVSVR
nr:HTTM domain-containing protein [Streptomyces albidus (ex Kaewkla and Franco 2022)]